MSKIKINNWFKIIESLYISYKIKIYRIEDENKLYDKIVREKLIRKRVSPPRMRVRNPSNGRKCSRAIGASLFHILHGPERTEPTITRIAPYAIPECSDRPCDLQPVFPAWP